MRIATQSQRFRDGISLKFSSLRSNLGFLVTSNLKLFRFQGETLLSILELTQTNSSFPSILSRICLASVSTGTHRQNFFSIIDII